MRPVPSLSLIIPAFNEAAEIGATLHQVRAYLDGLGRTFEVRVVDDGSMDSTPEIVRAVAHVDDSVVLQREPHRGKGGTVRAGMLASAADLRFLCDADLSMPIQELPRFIDAMATGADIAIGSREGLGAKRIGEPAYRHAMGRVFNGLVRSVRLTDFGDTQCGFKMFSARAAQDVFGRARLDGWAFDIEALAIAAQLGFRITEIPIEWHHRSTSRVSAVRDTIAMTRDILRVRWRLMRAPLRTRRD